MRRVDRLLGMKLGWVEHLMDRLAPTAMDACVVIDDDVDKPIRLIAQGDSRNSTYG